MTRMLILKGSACLHIVYVDAMACLHIHYVDGVACLHIVQVIAYCPLLDTEPNQTKLL